MASFSPDYLDPPLTPTDWRCHCHWYLQRSFGGISREAMDADGENWRGLDVLPIGACNG
jgi:hypothetical protein